MKAASGCVVNESMTSKRFILIFASIFLLGAMPFLIYQPNGAASAGLSSGFTLPIEKLVHMLIFLCIGFYASLQRGSAVMMMPLAFIFLFITGVSLEIDHSRYAMMPMFMLGSVMLFSVSMAIISTRAGVLGMAVAASFGFHFGRHYISQMPDIASPIYFLLGNIIAFALIFATAISFGLTMRADSHAREGSR